MINGRITDNFYHKGERDSVSIRKILIF
jgi:hypothetical protein